MSRARFFFEDAEWKAFVAYKTQNTISPDKLPELREAIHIGRKPRWFFRDDKFMLSKINCQINMLRWFPVKLQKKAKKW